MDVTTFLEPTVDLERLAAVLDGLGHEGRVHTTRTWTARQQKALFEAAKGFREGDLGFLVPPDRGTLEEVIHDGINTLPLFRSFQKRFTKDESASVFGYNEQTWSWFSGPGYFSVRLGEGEHAGELVIEYSKIPSHKPSSWPAIRDNDGGTRALVFGRLTDYVRPISAHVSLGSGYKGSSHQGFFALVRRDPS
jgi:hypothetical protein